MISGFKPIFTITHPITGGLTRIERARGFLESAMLSEQWVQEMGQRALLLEAHHTTHIEGTRLTLEQSRLLLEGSLVPDADPEDAKDLLNYRQAFGLVSDYVAGGGSVTEGLIREIHRRLGEGVRGGAAGPGEHRRIQNYVVNALTGETVYEPPPAYDVPIMRASRLLSTLCLYRAGYDFKRLFTISEYYDRNRPAFYRALQSVRESGVDLTAWLEYVVEGLASQLTARSDGVENEPSDGTSSSGNKVCPIDRPRRSVTLSSAAA